MKFQQKLNNAIKKNNSLLCVGLDPDLHKLPKDYLKNLSKDDFLKLDQTPGVFAAILNELAINNINVYETLSCLFEIIIFVDEKDLLKSYEVLMGLCGE